MQRVILVWGCLLIVAITSTAVWANSTAVLTEGNTRILFDGEEIAQLRGFAFKIYKDRHNARGVAHGRLHVRIAQ